ncbi:hypothetical protein ACWT_0844 [Actinoplanes sp. SE50]|uniref:hypothetical protein n=1 Tax=unclassified Actinoplanes TaxID=2626549 RepID=UPI00023EC1EA|nr:MULTISPECIES: hypothetical protein [unclassified Actinoplanes]AEV81858.1 hypothetical protein ACPL_961 [Actinoplanes sp. SE50/110]ATO80259.1 hypothetical protein ACWT_0844 [Actinoplanes sp. SE50]SLL97664.1 hypothetical protein ACSP50_0873 [Actinoplanes sp. SE50/110]
MSPSSANEARYSGYRDAGERFRNPDEHDAWAQAEVMMEQARAMMREAEDALETWKTGKEMNRLRCERRGISQTDAEIRWSATTTAKNAITNNNFYVSLASMYYGAASANYSRALYLRSHGSARF